MLGGEDGLMLDWDEGVSREEEGEAREVDGICDVGGLGVEEGL